MSELDEFVAKKRFEEIHEARAKAIETKQAISKAWIMNRVDYGTACQMYRGAIEDFILEIEELIRSCQDDLETDYWEGVPLGDIELPDGSMQPINGLKTLLELPESLTFTYEKEVKHPRKGHITENVSEEVHIPLDISRAAFQEANHFLNDAGLDIEVHINKGDAGFRYEDILEEGPPEEGDLREASPTGATD